MIADSLRQSPDTVGNARIPGNLPIVPPVPFVSGNDPSSERRPANFEDRFGEWTNIRRLSRVEPVR